MFYGVRDLFSESPTLPRNKKLKEKEKIISLIYSKSILFRKGNPIIHLYYVNTGKWEDDEKLKARINQEVDLLKDLNIFRDVVFEPIDAATLQLYYSRAKNAISKTVTFANKVTLPDMDGVKEAYLGFLSAKEYLTLVTDENKNSPPEFKLSVILSSWDNWEPIINL